MHYSFWEKLGAGLLVTAWLLYIGNAIGNKMVPHGEIAAPTASADSADAAPAADAAPVDALTLLAGADIKAGKKAYGKCKACHTSEQGGKNKVGPNLFDIVGRPRASAADFAYSGALSGAGGHWGYAELDAFLASPKSAIPGNKMSFKGVSDPAKRAALIAYLRTLSANPLPLP